jgi:hypothetical protein
LAKESRKLSKGSQKGQKGQKPVKSLGQKLRSKAWSLVKDQEFKSKEILMRDG